MAKKMYIDGFPRRITANELSDSSGGWDEGLGREGVWHEPLDRLSPISEEAAPLGEGAVAFARDLANTLDGAELPAGEADTIGRIAIFSDDGEKGLPSVALCSEALGLRETIDVDGDDLVDIREESTVTAMDWGSRIEKGFCYDEWDDNDELRKLSGDHQRRIVETTARMDAELEDYFEFNMTDEVVCAPVLYGGRHGRAIVAVLGMRVWT